MSSKRKGTSRSIAVFALFLLVILSGCTTVGTMELYTMDLRSLRMPAMLNQEAEAQQGFSLQASIFETYNTQSFYSQYMSFTTAQSKESTIPLDLQIRTVLLPEVFAVHVKSLEFSYHKMRSSGRSEDKSTLFMDVWLEER